MFPTRPRLAARSTCSSCGTPACITATRVSCGVQLIRMSSVIYGQAPRQGRAACFDSRTSADASVSPPGASSSSPGLEFRDQLRSLVQRQPHDPGVAAVQLGDERRRAALDRVGARLVGRLAALDVGFDLGPRELAEANLALAYDELGALVEFQRDRGEHAVLASGQEAQHARRVGAVGGLAEDFLIDTDDGVGGEHRELAQLALHGPLPACVGLGPANAANVTVGGFPRPQRLVDVGAARGMLAQHQYFERNADLLQELAPARAARGEVDLRFRRSGLHSRWYGRWSRIEAAR